MVRIQIGSVFCNKLSDPDSVHTDSEQKYLHIGSDRSGFFYYIVMFLLDAYFLYLLHYDVLSDELLTLSSDAECGSLVKMLVAAIAGSNHAPEAQTSIVTEVLLLGYQCFADPGSGGFLTPRSGMGKKSGPGSGMNNSDHIF